MYKWYVFIFLIILCITCNLIINESDSTEMVFNDNSNNYGFYIIDVSKENINTKNIIDFFDDIKIIEIYPKINPIYEKIIKMKSYSFNNILSNKKNISNFIKYYQSLLNKNALKQELTKFNLNGIKINKIKIYSSIGEVNYLISQHKISIIKKYI